MTPEAKAKELIKTYQGKFGFDELSRKLAKECAAICVKEIIEALGGSDYPSGSSVVPRNIIYWNRVLEQINNL